MRVIVEITGGAVRARADRHGPGVPKARIQAAIARVVEEVLAAQPEPARRSHPDEPVSGPHAFAALYETYHPAVYRYVLGKVGGHHLAEDITAAAFERAFKAIGRYEDQGKDIGAWLITIARNLVFDHAKRASTRRVSYGDEALNLADAIPRQRCGVETAQVRAELGDLLRGPVAILNDRDRDLIRELFLEDRTPSYVALRSGRSVGAIKAHRARILQRLRDAGVAS